MERLTIKRVEVENKKQWLIHQGSLSTWIAKVDGAQLSVTDKNDRVHVFFFKSGSKMYQGKVGESVFLRYSTDDVIKVQYAK